FLPVLDPIPVLSAGRALLARGRWDVEHGRPADADSVVRAAITVGRHLQDDLALPHVVLGARIEREAVQMLAAVYHNAGRFAQRAPAPTCRRSSRASSAAARRRSATTCCGDWPSRGGTKRRERAGQWRPAVDIPARGRRDSHGAVTKEQGMPRVIFWDVDTQY